MKVEVTTEKIELLKKMCVKKCKELNLYNDEYKERLKLEFNELRKWKLFESKDMGEELLKRLEQQEEPANTNKTNSLVLYLIGMTTVNPMETGKDLVTYKTKSTDCPDIDLDFRPDVRDWIKEYIVEEFGEKHTCSIGTYQTYKTKAVIIDVARALGNNIWEVQAVTKKLETNISTEGDSGEMEDQSIDSTPLEELRMHFTELDKYFNENEEVLQHAKILRNQIKNMGKHAGGMIISNLDLNGRIPVCRNSAGQIQSTWTEGMATHELSSVGLVKFDILGLRGLQVIQDCVDYIKENRGIELKKKDINYSDREAIRIGSKVDLVGIFQFENPATKPVSDAVKMESLDDISAVTSLIRPGPRDMGMDQEYALRKHGKPYIKYDFLKDILQDTHFVLCIHEDTNISITDGSSIPIKDMYKGCGVYSYNLVDKIEPDICDGAAYSKTENGIKIVLDNGMFVILTNDHNVLTNRGYKEAQNLSMSDLVTISIDKKITHKKIRSIEIVYNKRFHSMSVRKNHNMIANGIIIKNCYQEQCMLIAQKLAGFTPVESNKLRKVLVKEKDPEKLEQMRQKFIKGSQPHIDAGRITLEEVESIYETVHSFSRYGFNKSLTNTTLVKSITFDGKIVNKQIQDFKSGDKVLTYNESTKEIEISEVVELHDHDDLEGFEITFDDKSTIVCSINHKFLTRERMKPLHYILDNELDVLSFEDELCQKKIINVKSVGKKHMYDLEIDHPSHSFILSNDVITSNSHAYTYSALSGTEFFLKYNYLVEYMTALINNAKASGKKGETPMFVKYINYSRKNGIKVLPPHVNKSKDKFTIEDGKIRFSLGHIKNLGKSATNIRENQPYEDFGDFFSKVNKRIVNKRVVNNLIFAGAFDDWGTRQEMLDKYYTLRKEKKAPEEFSMHQWEEKEIEAISMCLSRDPLLIEHDEEIRNNRWTPISKATLRKRPIVFGKIEDIKKTKSKSSGKDMMVVTITDDIDEMRFYVWRNAFMSFTQQVKKGYIGAFPLDSFENGSDLRFFDPKKEIIIIKK